MQEIRKSNLLQILRSLCDMFECYAHSKLNIYQEYNDRCRCKKYDMTPFYHTHFHLLDKTILLYLDYNYAPTIDSKIHFLTISVINSLQIHKRYIFCFVDCDFTKLSYKFIKFIKKNNLGEL